MAIWLTGGMIAAVLVHFGVSSGRTVPIYLAGAAVLAAFVAHIITNAVYDTTFTRHELTLALALYGLALLAFALAALLEPAFRANLFQAFGLVLIVVGAAVLFYMVTHYGVRGVFDAFNVVRDAGVRRTPERPQTRWRVRR
jgi:hypothetical protein